VHIRKGERWRCQNSECGSEVFVTLSSRVESSSQPRCSCGEVMKKPYVRPELDTFDSSNEGPKRFQAMSN
jgi:hypothetical protein